MPQDSISKIFENETAISDIVNSAAIELLKFREKSNGKSLNIQNKSDSSIVTAADYASNTILTSGLNKLFPDIPVISEESDQTIVEDLQHGYFLIDPLDGTSRFVEGADDFAILVSFIDYKGQPIAGWVSFPALGELYVAINDKLIASKPVTQEIKLDTNVSSIYVRQDSNSSQHVAVEESLLNKEGLHSGEAFRRLFLGKISGVVLELGRLGSWDIAAPIAIINSLGGSAVDIHGREFLFNESVSGRTLIAGSKQTIEKILDY